MSIDGQQVLMLFIAVVSTLLAVSLNKWYFKLPFFIAALGSSAILAGLINASPELLLFFESVLFLVTGITSIRAKGLGNIILGVLLGILGVVLFLLLLNSFGTTPGTIRDGIAQSVGQGLQEFLDTIRQAITGSA